MIGRDPIEALNTYARLTQAALHCVSAAKIRRPTLRVDEQRALILDRNQPIRLSRSGDRRQISFGFRQYFRVVEMAESTEGRYRILVEDYEYKIIDSRERELFVFHWHPASVSEATWPHVHVGSVVIDAAAEGMEPSFYERFSRLHIPTGMLAVEQVVRFLITELVVAPMRADWDAMLQEGEAAFLRERPWQGVE